MTATHENCLPLNWLLALPTRVRVAIIHCELTLDDTLRPPASDWHAGARRFIPPSGAESPEERPSPSPAEGVAAERLERLAAACRIPEETILQYIRARWDRDCASVSSAPPAVLEEIVRAWPDILTEITAAKWSRHPAGDDCQAPEWHRHPACDPGKIPARPSEDTLSNENHANLHVPQHGIRILPVSVATL